MAQTMAKKGPAGGNELKLAVLIGMATAVLLLAAWGFNQVVGTSTEVEHPKPTWLGVSKVRAQTMDGQTLLVKVNFLIKDKEELEILAPYEPVFKSLVSEAGAAINSEEVKGSERVLQFGDTVKQSVNEYLNEQRIKPRIKRVAFEEFRVIPS